MFHNRENNTTMNPVIQEENNNDDIRGTRITAPELELSSSNNSMSEGFSIDVQLFLEEDLKRVLSLLKQSTTDMDINKMLIQLNAIVNDLSKRIKR
jgi:hypothetical protein